MRLHLYLHGLDIADYPVVAERAEEFGCAGIWLPDHLIAPTAYDSAYPYSESGRPSFTAETPLPDIFGVLSYIAAKTTTLLLGTGIYILPLRHPIPTAGATLTLQELSNGRLLFGIGTGWLREEFNAVGQSFANRGARTDEIMSGLRLLWRGEPVRFDGDHIAFDEVRLSPPASTPIPIIVGGMTRPALRRAASLADGWIGMPLAAEESIVVRAEIEEQRRALGRMDRPFSYFLRAKGVVDADLFESYERAGFTDLMVASQQIAGPGASADAVMTALEGLVSHLSRRAT